MASLPHLFPRETQSVEAYKYPRPVRGPDFNAPPRDRIPHATQLRSDLTDIEAAPSDPTQAGHVLEFESDPDFKLKLESLEYRRSGIELRNSRVDDDGVMRAAVFVPRGKVDHFVKRIEQYCEQDKKSGEPKHKELIESISRIRLATLVSLWSDVGSFPMEHDKQLWWELWLSELADDNVGALFRKNANAAGITVAAEELHFPERRVVLARGSINGLINIERLLDVLAELRLAKLLPSELLDLPPSGQAEYIDEALTRISFSTASPISVCHLDTGINRGHPLLEPAIDADHVLTVDPNWSPADRNGHGTEMAGIALYGCLTEVLHQVDSVDLVHELESVKILSYGRTNDPALWGALTQQAASRIEIAAPHRRGRAFCLTVTADGRDEGLPSSWSAALDQAAAETDKVDRSRLFFVAAGNVSLDGRNSYPERNLVEGIEDPGQSWNAITVGGVTEKHSIRQRDFEGWTTVAPAGSLSPSSRTSCVWSDKSWPLKPDIVMEAGNMARNPDTGNVDYVDDLAILTTRVSVDGSLLTTSCDTSAASALGARFAARLWAEYPHLRPETVRALMVHSAEWTPQMHELMDGGTQESLLRCFGHGVPNLERASHSALHAATLVVESALQPFEKEVKVVTSESGSTHTRSRIVTKDMHFHRIPWPTSVLRDLGESEVRMRITLSYFIEPSPGRRGWTRKHRYQSHGLRFDVKRPTDSDEEFRKRITASARDEDENYAAANDERQWLLGRNLRSKGSIHSDTWTGIAADLANANLIAVFPVTGWWKERPHLDCFNKTAPYSLIVTIATEETSIDLYTPIANAIGIVNPGA